MKHALILGLSAPLDRDREIQHLIKSMRENRFKLIVIPGVHVAVLAQIRKESGTLRNHSFWVIRRSDELVVKSQQAISRSRELLRLGGVVPVETEAAESSDCAWLFERAS